MKKMVKIYIQSVLIALIVLLGITASALLLKIICLIFPSTICY